MCWIHVFFDNYMNLIVIGLSLMRMDNEPQRNTRLVGVRVASPQPTKMVAMIMRYRRAYVEDASQPGRPK